jgi:hypothetical protein
MDERSALSYPETDKSGNVRFYQGFGYALVADAFVLGVRTWFMIRRPRIHCFSKRLPRASPGASQSSPTAE